MGTRIPLAHTPSWSSFLVQQLQKCNPKYHPKLELYLSQQLQKCNPKNQLPADQIGVILQKHLSICTDKNCCTQAS